MMNHKIVIMIKSAICMVMVGRAIELLRLRLKRQIKKGRAYNADSVIKLSNRMAKLGLRWTSCAEKVKIENFEVIHN